MDERNTASRNRWAMGIRAATLVVVIGTIAAVWHPTSMHSLATTAKEAVTAGAAAETAAMPLYVAPRDANASATMGDADKPDYFPSHFAAPQHEDPEAPTF